MIASAVPAMTWTSFKSKNGGRTCTGSSNCNLEWRSTISLSHQQHRAMEPIVTRTPAYISRRLLPLQTTNVKANVYGKLPAKATCLCICRTGAVVYIDYKAQFQEEPSSPSKRRRAAPKPKTARQGNAGSKAKKGYSSYRGGHKRARWRSGLNHNNTYLASWK